MRRALARTRKAPKAGGLATGRRTNASTPPWRARRPLRSPERIDLRQTKPSARLQRDVAHGLGPTVNRLGVHRPPGGISTVAGLFVYGRSAFSILRLDLKIGRY